MRDWLKRLFTPRLVVPPYRAVVHHRYDFDPDGTIIDVNMLECGHTLAWRMAQRASLPCNECLERGAR